MHALKIVLLIIALVLLIVSVATPMWVTMNQSADGVKIAGNQGLWEACFSVNEKTQCGKNTCLLGSPSPANSTDACLGKNDNMIYNAVRSLSLLSILLVLIAIICCLTCKKKTLPMVMIALALLACVSVIGVAGDKIVMNNSIPDSRPGYSFWLQVAAGALLLLVFVMKLIVKGKKM